MAAQCNPKGRESRATHLEPCLRINILSSKNPELHSGLSRHLCEQSTMSHRSQYQHLVKKEPVVTSCLRINILSSKNPELHSRADTSVNSQGCGHAIPGLRSQVLSGATHNSKLESCLRINILSKGPELHSRADTSERTIT